MSTLMKTGLVALVLLEVVRVGKADLPPGTDHSFEPPEAERLVRLGAAVPADSDAARRLVAAQPAREAREAVTEIERIVEVRALSKEGGRFLSFKHEDRVAAFVAECTDPATLAEFQALEYRREGGPRAAVLAALTTQFDAVARAAGSGDAE